MRAPRVLVLGAGMAGLTTAWELTRTDRPGPTPEVTVVQRGWRAGGKAASSRGPSGRIEEHGLHVWLGYYDNAFRLVRSCYEELDRARTDPSCPVRTWRDAFSPTGGVGVAVRGEAAAPWIAHFARDDRLPGDPTASSPPDPADFVVRALGLVVDLLTSVSSRSRPSVTLLTGSPEPPPVPPRSEDLAALARALQLGVVAVGARAAATFSSVVGVRDERLFGSLVAQLDGLSDELTARLVGRPDGRRLLAAVDLLLGCVRGIVTDRLLDTDRGFAAVDHLDFREWLARHGTEPATLRSGIVTGMYDLVFAYEGGDPARPRFAAGQGLELAGRFFFAYRGALMWRMTAGMGDVVVAPLVEVLTRRGVRFRFHTEVDRLELRPDRLRLSAVHLRRQSAGTGPTLERVGGIPCFPRGPEDQEHHGRSTGPTHAVRLGEDVDVVVLATSLGVLPLIGASLLERSDRWRNVCRRVGTVSTVAGQLWFRDRESALGWTDPGAITAGWGPPFDTYASMSHLLDVEEWDDDDAPGGLAYLCGVLPDDVARRADAELHAASLLDRFVDDGLDRMLPALRRGSVRSRFSVAASDPSDRYVQSLPGSRDARLAAAGSGVEGLVLAGDWTDNGIDAGCIEAAVVSGIQAANAVLGHDPRDGVLGGWQPRSREEALV